MSQELSKTKKPRTYDVEQADAPALYTTIAADPAEAVAPVTVIMPPVQPLRTKTLTILVVVIREFVRVRLSLFPAANVVVTDVI